MRPRRRVSSAPRRVRGCALALALAACTTSPLGRQQLQLFSEADMARMGSAAFQQVKAETPRVSDSGVEAYVRCVAGAITRRVEPQRSWEVVVFREADANAFALPGGKIGVLTGMLRVARTQDQLATVIAHEVAHVLAAHPNERVSTTYAAQQGLQLAQAVAGGPGGERNQLMGLLGLGAQFGVLMPFDRAQEREADLLGLDLMAEAGFDPAASLELWQNMAAASGGSQPPEFLSTHPAPEARMAELRARLPRAQAISARARSAGVRPSCGD